MKIQIYYQIIVIWLLQIIIAIKYQLIAKIYQKTGLKNNQQLF
jgi:uncharacterized membrane protein YagU involved in acid resistance